MDTAYWNKIATAYESEIFNLFSHDKYNKLGHVIRKHGRAGTVAADFGCGIGNGLPLLSAAFKRVDAFDLSYKNVDKCRAIHSRLSNVDYFSCDLAKRIFTKRSYDFAINVCVLIMPSLTTRQRVLKNMLDGVKKGGVILVVVPSFESAIMVNAKLIEWNLYDGLKPSAAVQSGFDREPDMKATDFRQGILPIEGVRTKHYVHQELLGFFGSAGTVHEVFKVAYDWEAVFDGLPESLQSSLPWDWAVVIGPK